MTAAGWALGRIRLLGGEAEAVLARLVFFVAAPALLFSTLAVTPVEGIFTKAFIPFLASTLLVAVTAAAAAYRRWGFDLGEGTVATMSASYVNAGYLGIPVAVFVLGDVSFAVPVVLFQVLFYTPIVFALLDARAGTRGMLAIPLRNPIILACAAGSAVTLSGWTPPAEILRPFELTGAAAVPLALLALGLSLSGARPLRNGPDAEPRYAVVVAKILAQPAVAFVFASLLGLEGDLLLAAVVMSGLPTAQNVFVYATRFGLATRLARDAIVLSTLLGAVTLLLTAIWLG